MILQAVVGGFVLDALFGDPAWLPHPVVLMGRCISRLEKFLRARLPGTPQGELLGGAVTAFCLPVTDCKGRYDKNSRRHLKYRREFCYLNMKFNFFTFVSCEKVITLYINRTFL